MKKILTAIILALRSNYVNRLFRRKLFSKALIKNISLSKDQQQFVLNYGVGTITLVKNKLRRGEIFFCMGKYRESIRVTQEVIRDIEQNEILNVDEKKHLIYFARLIIYGSYCGLKKHSEEPTIGDINLANISKPTLRNFPVRTHPDWYKYFPDDKSNNR